LQGRKELAKIVIIGLGTAGISACLTIRKRYPKNEVIIIDKKEFDLLHSCGLPFLLDGRVDSPEKLKYTLKISGIKKHLNCEATEINPQEKSIKVKNLESGERENVSYDSLILATGTTPFIPPIPGLRELKDKRAFTIEDLEGVARLKEAAKRAKEALVIGAGATGLEAAVALNKKGLEVIIVEALKSLLPKALDPDMSEILEERLREKGIKILLNKRVERVDVKSVTIEGEEIPNDIIIISCGVRPNSELAKKAGIKISNYGIVTDERMETSIKGVYACGDCAQVSSLIDKRPLSAYLATPAYEQGKVAAINASGGEARYGGALATFVSLIADLEIASTGFNKSQVESYGYEVVEGKARSLIKPKWFPGGKEMTSKIIANAKTGKILGAQEIGEEGTGWRINIVSLAIKANLSLEDLSKVEFAYSPATSHIPDVLLTATDLALRKLEKK
jgi:NADH oxidase (H2O2-forming)